ncbi:Potassium Voltage-Gated Channel Subfamily H Member 2, partial [Manis pentadactyla]
PSVLRSVGPVPGPPACRPVRAESPAEPSWWTRAVLGCAFLPARRSQRHRPRPSASDLLLAPAGLPAPHSPLRASPAAGGGRQSARTWSRCPGRTCARPARPPPAWRRPAARPGPPPPPPRGSRGGAVRLPQRVGQHVPRRPHRQGRREPCREAASVAANLRRSVRSGPRFRGEGDSDGSAGRKLEEVSRDYQNRALKLSLKCLQPQVVGYSQVSGYVDVVADKISGEAANPGKSPSLQRNKEEVSLCTNMMRKISLKKKLKRGAKVNTTRWDLSKRPAFLSPAHHSPRVGHSEGSSDDRVQHLCP